MPNFQLVTSAGVVLGAPGSSAGLTPGSVIDTGPEEPNLRVVRVLETEEDDPEIHLNVPIVEQI
jgi:hypothetical protein